jgi:hypothetical protein
MLYGTPPRATHRATAGGGLALWVFGGAGQHRLPARRPEPQRAAQLLAQGLAALIVLGLTTLIGYLVVADTQRARGAPETTIADDEPLTVQEVFPDPRQVTTPATYQIAMTHTDRDCATATTGALGALLADHGCSQVVRAALTAPYGDYQVTTGLFNLADAAGATALDGQLRQLVETGDGSFAAMATGEPGADPTVPPASQVGWRSRGHYLLYCVITRPGGAVVPNDDPNAGRITADLVDGYLDAGVLGKRGGTA